MERAIGYIRVSTDKQELGPEAQRDAIHAWAKKRSIEIVEIFEDLGISGAAGLEKRPGLAAAIGSLKKSKASILVAAKRDRFARDVYLALSIEHLVKKSKARMETTDGVGEGDTVESQFLKVMIDAASQLERGYIRQRVKAALQVKRGRLEFLGECPYGYCRSGQGLVMNPKEQQNIQRILELHLQGYSQRAICRILEDDKVPPRLARNSNVRRGDGKWHQPTIARILKLALDNAGPGALSTVH